MSDKERINDFKTHLSKLKSLSKNDITTLTILASMNLSLSEQIVDVVEAHFAKVPSNQKLSLLYLIDSIIKYVPENDYLQHFSKTIVFLFISTYKKVDQKTRDSMFELRQTWNKTFPQKILYAMDFGVKNLNPEWPMSAKPKDDDLTPVRTKRKLMSPTSTTPEENSSIPMKSINLEVKKSVVSEGTSERNQGVDPGMNKLQSSTEKDIPETSSLQRHELTGSCGRHSAMGSESTENQPEHKSRSTESTVSRKSHDAVSTGSQKKHFRLEYSDSRDKRKSRSSSIDGQYRHRSKRRTTLKESTNTSRYRTNQSEKARKRAEIDNRERRRRRVSRHCSRQARREDRTVSPDSNSVYKTEILGDTFLRRAITRRHFIPVGGITPISPMEWFSKQRSLVPSYSGTDQVVDRTVDPAFSGVSTEYEMQGHSKEICHADPSEETFHEDHSKESHNGQSFQNVLTTSESRNSDINFVENFIPMEKDSAMISSEGNVSQTAEDGNVSNDHLSVKDERRSSRSPFEGGINEQNSKQIVLEANLASKAPAVDKIDSEEISYQLPLDTLLEQLKAAGLISSKALPTSAESTNAGLFESKHLPESAQSKDAGGVENVVQLTSTELTYGPTLEIDSDSSFEIICDESFGSEKRFQGRITRETNSGYTVRESLDDVIDLCDSDDDTKPDISLINANSRHWQPDVTLSTDHGLLHWIETTSPPKRVEFRFLDGTGKSTRVPWSEYEKLPEIPSLKSLMENLLHTENGEHHMVVFVLSPSECTMNDRASASELLYEGMVDYFIHTSGIGGFEDHVVLISNNLRTIVKSHLERKLVGDVFGADVKLTWVSSCKDEEFSLLHAKGFIRRPIDRDSTGNIEEIVEAPTNLVSTPGMLTLPPPPSWSMPLPCHPVFPLHPFLMPPNALAPSVPAFAGYRLPRPEMLTAFATTNVHCQPGCHTRLNGMMSAFPVHQPPAPLNFNIYHGEPITMLTSKGLAQPRPVNSHPNGIRMSGDTPREPQNSEEFERTLETVKTMYDRAMHKACEDANQGEFQAAVKTLTSAVTLMNRSRISSDHKCQDMIADLQYHIDNFKQKSHGFGRLQYMSQNARTDVMPDRNLSSSFRHTSPDRSSSSPPRQTQSSDVIRSSSDNFFSIPHKSTSVPKRHDSLIPLPHSRRRRYRHSRTFSPRHSSSSDSESDTRSTRRWKSSKFRETGI